MKANQLNIDLSDIETGIATPTGDTGQSRIAINVVASWIGQFVFIVAGFILPRMIDRHISQEALGVWDFTWSVVAYFSLVQGGIVSSVNRYVAKYRSEGDMKGLNCAVSSVSCILAIMGVVVLGLSVAVAAWLPDLFSKQLNYYQRDAQWLVLLLGSSIAVQIIFSGYGGVITGCHRWDLHNLIFGGTRLGVLVGSIIILLLDAGLIGLAALNLFGELAGWMTRCFAAYHICPGLKVRLSHVRWSQASKMLVFGGKSFIPSVAKLILTHTTSIFIVGYLGPAALAIYSRPRALVRHAQTILAKFSYVITPTASALQATGRNDELRKLLINTARWSGYITLPLIVTLVILGGPLLNLWMGSVYEEKGAAVLVVLALGNTASIIVKAVQGILVGINAHGRPGLANLIAALISMALTAVALGPMQGELLSAALAVTVPSVIVDGIYVPFYACRRLKIPFYEYLIETLRGPILAMIPLTLTLASVSVVFAEKPLLCLISGGTVGAATVFVFYWLWVIPASVKAKIKEWLSRKWGRRAEESV